MRESSDNRRPRKETVSAPTPALLAITLARLVMNITRRFPYPFLPVISKDLGVSTADMERVIALQSAIGVSSPLIGPFVDRLGRRVFMIGTLVLLTLASFIGAIFPHFAPVFWVFMLWGIAKAIYDPAMQAYIADHVPYNRRGFAIGLNELSWAIALMIGAPLAGFLLSQFNLSAIFWILAIASTAALIMVIIVVPSDNSQSNDSAKLIIKKYAMSWLTLLKNRASLGAIISTMLFISGNENLYIVYGSWMQSSFTLQLTALGFATIVLSLSEVVGDGLVIGWADRIGKRRMLLIALLLTSLGYLILPHLVWSLAATLIGLFLTFLTFEITVVVSISMFTEISSESRGTIMSGNIAGDRIGRFAGALLGSYLYTLGGFALNGLISMVLSLIALVIIWFFIEEANIPQLL